MHPRRKENLLVRGVNQMFWMLVGFSLIILATIVLWAFHDNNAAWIVSNLGTVLLLSLVGLLICLGKPDWVSSDKLVTSINRLQMKRFEKSTQ